MLVIAEDACDFGDVDDVDVVRPWKMLEDAGDGGRF
jgi:hypothetical protein